MEDAIKIWSHPEYFRVELAETLLSDAGITSFIMDKRDSSYPGILGAVHLYVSKADADQARELLKANEVDK